MSLTQNLVVLHRPAEFTIPSCPWQRAAMGRFQPVAIGRKRPIGVSRVGDRRLQPIAKKPPKDNHYLAFFLLFRLSY